MKKKIAVLPNTVNFHDCEIYKHGFQSLDALRRSGKLCDITLTTEDCRFSAHKVVLAATIPFFNGMFLSNMCESIKNEIAIHGLDACALEAFIGFAYSGLVQITPKNVQSILIGANFLQLNSVRNVCCKYISERLTVDTVLSIRNLAQSFLCTDLVYACETYIHENFEAVSKTPLFFAIEARELQTLLESDELRVSSEEHLFHILMSWIEYENDSNDSVFKSSIIANSGDQIKKHEIDLYESSYPIDLASNSDYSLSTCIHSPMNASKKSVKSRAEWLPDLLRCIRLPLMSVDFISSTIARHGLVRQNIKCRDLLDEVRDMLLMPGQNSRSFSCRPRRCQDVFGVIYAVGGLTADGDFHGIVERLHPSLGRWELSESMISKRSRIGVVALNGLLYAIGGFDGISRLNTTEVYNPKTRKWKSVAPMNCRRSAVGATALDDRLYVCGGFDGQTSLRTCEMYNPEQDTWHLIPSMNESRSAGGLVALNNGCLYAIGGHNGLAVFSSVEFCNRRICAIPGLSSSRSETNYNVPNSRANALSSVWKPVASMLHRRCRHGATALRDRIIVAGGYDGASFLNSVEVFDPLAGPDKNGIMGQWTEISSLSVPRSRVGLAVTAGVLYAIGGYDGTVNLRTVECFKPVSQQKQVPVYCRVNRSIHEETDSSSNNNNTPNNSNKLPQSHRNSASEVSSCYKFSLTDMFKECDNSDLEKENPGSSQNPFSNWRWSFAAPLIAHDGWVGVCVLPLNESCPQYMKTSSSLSSCQSN